MTIGIYNPYLNTLGGGERYCLDIAACLAERNDVRIFWDDPGILKAAEKRFHMSLAGVTLVNNIWLSGNTLAKANESRKYDVLFIVSDGSIPLVFSRKAFLIFQFPTGWVNGQNPVTKLKFRRITNVLCYSQFVKERVDKIFGINALVLPPAVDETAFRPAKKENLILSVGRFTTGMNTKKQEILIDAFKRAHKTFLKTWKFIVAGGMLPHDLGFVEKLKALAKGYPIEIVPNATHDNLVSYYGRARVYWHAAGYGENIEKNPQLAEHFGLTTLEAMAAGAVPVVFAGGGQKEIVGNWVSGFLWNTPTELIGMTEKLTSDTKVWSRVSRAAQHRARLYGLDAFHEKLNTIVV